MSTICSGSPWRGQDMHMAMHGCSDTGMLSCLVLLPCLDSRSPSPGQPWWLLVRVLSRDVLNASGVAKTLPDASNNETQVSTGLRSGPASLCLDQDLASEASMM
jgi:hypothetical protein